MTLFTDPAMSLSLCFLTDLPAVSPGMVNKGYTDAPGSLQLRLHRSDPVPWRGCDMSNEVGDRQWKTGVALTFGGKPLSLGKGAATCWKPARFQV